jgi:hypothetical protein
MNIINVHNLDFNFKLKTSKQIYQKILFFLTFQLSFYIQFYMAYVFLATLATFNLCVSKNS